MFSVFVSSLQAEIFETRMHHHLRAFAHPVLSNLYMTPDATSFRAWKLFLFQLWTKFHTSLFLVKIFTRNVEISVWATGFISLLKMGIKWLHLFLLPSLSQTKTMEWPDCVSLCGIYVLEIWSEMFGTCIVERLLCIHKYCEHVSFVIEFILG